MQEYLAAASSMGTMMEEEWKPKISKVRENAARLLGCSQDNIAFVPNVSSAVNLVAGGLDWQMGDNVVVTSDQFPANVYPWLFLQRLGVEIRFAAWQEQGFLDSIRSLLNNKTKVVAVSWVEFFSGRRHRLTELGILCKKLGIILVVDAIQGLGALPFSLAEVHADVVAVGGHKWLMGPSGQGVAYFSPPVMDKLHPAAFSWRSIKGYMNFDTYHLELKPGAQRFEGGTPNWGGIYSLGASIDLILRLGSQAIATQIKLLSTHLMEALRELPVEVLTPSAWSDRAGIVTFRPQGIRAQDLRQALLARNIVVSARRDALRASVHFYNTLAEVDKFIGHLKEILNP